MRNIQLKRIGRKGLKIRNKKLKEKKNNSNSDYIFK